MKLLCIGRNYAKHVHEMGGSDLPGEPLVFLKPPSARIATGGIVVLPRQSREVHHEVELVARIGTGGRHIEEEDALDHVDAYALGLDLTARDIQSAAKKNGAPWSIAKGFDTFAPVGEFISSDDVGDPQDLEIRLTVDGETRQHGTTGHMIFPVARLVAYLSSVFTLEAGDLIFTGTPEGVGPVTAGAVLEATGAGRSSGVELPTLRVTAHAEAAA